MLWWRLPLSLAAILLMRWMVKLSTPRSDWWQLVEWSQQATAWLRRRVNSLRARLLARLGFTGWAWERMRRRFQAGAYGEQGT